MRELAELEALLLAAHARGDRAALVACYSEAGDLLESAGQIDAACFVRTQAYVLALEAGDRATAARMYAVLVRHGREM